MDFRQDLNQKLNEIGGTDISSIIPKLIQMTKSFGGKIYLVGGAVRDEIMGKESKDYDFLVTKITLEDLAKQLQQVLPGAKVNEVGQSFGVVKMSYGPDEFDFAIPRSDVDRQNVKTDPNIPVEEDLLRRDLTINAMAKDLETGQIVNAPGMNGQEDLKNKILRAVGEPSSRFQEDPLRMLRVLQFAARFGFIIEPHTLQAIKENIDLLKGVSSERFYEEFFKAWTKGNADTTVFTHLIIETGLGHLMFGADFSPIPVKAAGSTPEERYLVQYIAWFLKGGEFRELDKRIDHQEYVVSARNLFKYISEPENKSANLVSIIKFLAKQGAKFPLIQETFTLISKDLGNKLKEVLNKPIIPRLNAGSLSSWELPVGGGELIDLAKEDGIELKGKAIGETTLKLILGYQNGGLHLTGDEKQDKDVIKDALKIVLKENYIKECVRIETLKSRMTNIFYK